jgi:hypothetical protein
MTTDRTPRYHCLMFAAFAAVLGCTGCSSTHPAAPRSTPQAPTAEHSGSSSGRPPVRPMAPTQSPAATRPVAAPDQQLATAVVPAPSRATSTPLGVARAWAIAANSSSYRDSSPGQWTVRARPFVTGIEARAEAALGAGGGGNTWAQIQNGRCGTRLGDLVAFIPGDAPTGAAVHIVYVSARLAVTCATGTDYLSNFAAQLRVQRLAGRWLVTLVRH